jgi:uncharacterized membrane protein YgcG
MAFPWLPVITGAAGFLGGLLGGRGRGRELRREPTLSREQQQIQQWLLRRFDQPLPTYERQLRAVMPERGQALLRGEPMFTAMPPLWEEYYKSAIETPMRRQYAEETTPGIREAFVGPGTYWSSMRAEAEQKGAEEFARQLAGQRATTALTAEQQAAQRAMGMIPIDIAMQESGITREYADWLRRQPGYTPQDEMALRYLEIPTQIGYWEPEQVSPFAQLLSQLGPLLASYFLGGTGGGAGGGTGGGAGGGTGGGTGGGGGGTPGG